MKFRNLVIIGLLAFITMMAPATATATDFDGSKPLLVAIIDIIECQSSGACEEVTPQEARLPRFLEIEFDKKQISEIGEEEEERTTEIQSITQDAGVLILQGAQDGRGWTINISTDSGNAVITVSDPMSGFVLFGACTPR